MKQIAIIGAGIAGLAAAQRLKKPELGITLFEKSRGLGGRMATRRFDDLQFDHGAQYFTAKGPRFSALVRQWGENGHADEWFDGAFVGSPGMTAPARAMAEGHTIVAGCQVAAIRKEGVGWSIFDASGLVKTPGNGSFSAVILAVPAPQAAPLVASAGVDLLELAKVRYAPCWALMLAFSERLSLLDDRAKPQDDAIAWISRNASKPGRVRETETSIVHATPDWSRQHLECSTDVAARELITRFQSSTEVHERPTFCAAHRWRYALVEETAEVASLWEDEPRLGACGDWCLGPRVEAAFDSGEALADAILQT